MTNERGVSVIETTIASLLATVIVLTIGSTTSQVQKTFISENDRIEMQQNARAILDLMSVYARSAGANRADAFSDAPFTTASELPIPQAGTTAVRLRADYDENGALSTDFPEDITVSWNDGTSTLTVGSVSIANVSNFLIRYYDESGNELTPPVGGWDVSSTADHGDTLTAIARIRFELQMESRHRDPATEDFNQATLVSDATVRNQLSLF
jgi:Tfp pilus assembly protein PilW